MTVSTSNSQQLKSQQENESTVSVVESENVEKYAELSMKEI